LQAKAHGFLKSHPHTSRTSIRPRAPPTKFLQCFCVFFKRTQHSNQSCQKPYQVFDVFCPTCFFKVQNNTTARSSTSSTCRPSHTMSKVPPTHKPHPNHAKSATHQVSALSLRVLQRTRRPNQIQCPTCCFLDVRTTSMREYQHPQPRHTVFKSLTHTQATTQLDQEHHPPSFGRAVALFKQHGAQSKA
jgi:hypothetical protein